MNSRISNPASSKTVTDPQSRGLLRRIAGLFALLCASTLAIAATAIATAGIHERAAARPPIAPPPLLQVRTLRVEMTDKYTTTEHYTGRIEPARTSRLAFERAGTVMDLLVDEGESVRAGDIVARLDTRLLQARRAELEARRDALEARAELARLTLDRKKQLKTRGFATGQDHDNARLALAGLNASIKEVDAALLSTSIDMKKSVLTAPYAGTIAERRLDEGAIVNAGMAVVDLIETGRPQIRIGVPQDHADRFTADQTFVVDYSGKRLTARFVTLRPDIDPATRTLVALFDLDPMPHIRFGATADLVLEVERRETGYWIPLTALRSGIRGLWTVQSIVAGPDGTRIGLESVEILSVDGEQAFVRGTLSDGTAIVMEGGHRTVPGMAVKPIEIATPST